MSARKVFDDLLNVFQRHFHGWNEGWDKMIEFVCVDNCPAMVVYLDHQFEWYFDDKEFTEKVNSVYNMESLKIIKADFKDHLGDMYVENQSRLSKSYKGQYLTPENVVEMICKMTIQETEDPINILDPATGTGRFLMYAHKQAPNARLYGVDIDMRALRIAFTNCAIHNISAMFLNADSLIHDTDIAHEEGRYNWQFANKWEPSWDKLKTYAARPESSPIKTLERFNEVMTS